MSAIPDTRHYRQIDLEPLNRARNRSYAIRHREEVRRRELMQEIANKFGPVDQELRKRYSPGAM